MDSILIICALLCCSATFICMIATGSIIKRLNNLESDLLDCATRSRNTYLELNTLANKVNKPKKKTGRPSKKAPKPSKIIHHLNGE